MMFSCQEQLEDTYLKHIVYGLLIQKGDEKPYGAEVFFDIIILAITKEDSNGNQKVYVYDRKGNKTELKDN